MKYYVVVLLESEESYINTPCLVYNNDGNGIFFSTDKEEGKAIIKDLRKRFPDSVYKFAKLKV